MLRHGHAIEGTSYDLYDRDMWRVGTIATITNGRFTVCYDQEEGKPREARIAPERIRPRQIIRQKAVEKVTHGLAGRARARWGKDIFPSFEDTLIAFLFYHNDSVSKSTA